MPTKELLRSTSQTNFMPHILYTRFQSLPEGRLQGFYPGVLIIEQGPAKGHFAVKDGNQVVPCDYNVDEHCKAEKYQINIGSEALDDVVRCASESSDGVKCKLDHGSTVRDIVGVYTNFRRDGGKVRADLTLMKSTPHGAYVEELISVMSNKIGNSIDFIPSYEIQGNIAVARCRKLNSVDIVDSPAATNSLYEEKPTQPETHMPLNAEDLAAIGGLIDTKLSAHETKLNTRFEKVEEKMEEAKEKMDEDGGDDDDKKKKDEDKDKEKEKEEMSARIEKATLAAIEKVLPKAKLQSLASLADHSEKKDEYEEKVALSHAAGIKDSQITRHIARTFPAIYNAKFGNPVAGATV